MHSANISGIKLMLAYCRPADKVHKLHEMKLHEMRICIEAMHNAIIL